MSPILILLPWKRYLYHFGINVVKIVSNKNIDIVENFLKSPNVEMAPVWYLVQGFERLEEIWVDEC